MEPRWHEKTISAGVFTSILAVVVTIFIFIVSFTLTTAVKAEGDVVTLRDTIEQKIDVLTERISDLDAEVRVINSQHASIDKSLESILKELQSK